MVANYMNTTCGQYFRAVTISFSTSRVARAAYLIGRCSFNIISGNSATPTQVMIYLRFWRGGFQYSVLMANLFVKCIVVVLLLNIWLWSCDAQITIDDVRRVFPPINASDSRYVVKLRSHVSFYSLLQSGA